MLKICWMRACVRLSIAILNIQGSIQFFFILVAFVCVCVCVCVCVRVCMCSYYHRLLQYKHDLKTDSIQVIRARKTNLITQNFYK